eukprot:1283372-Amphidinium_carterae.1
MHPFFHIVIGEALRVFQDAPSLVSSWVYGCCVDVDASQDKGSKSSKAWYDLAAGIAKAKRLMSKAVSDVESTLMGLVEQTKETVKSVEELPASMTKTLSREVDEAVAYFQFLSLWLSSRYLRAFFLLE